MSESATDLLNENLSTTLGGSLRVGRGPRPVVRAESDLKSTGRVIYSQRRRPRSLTFPRAMNRFFARCVANQVAQAALVAARCFCGMRVQTEAVVLRETNSNSNDRLVLQRNGAA